MLNNIDPIAKFLGRLTDGLSLNTLLLSGLLCVAGCTTGASQPDRVIEERAASNALPADSTTAHLFKELMERAQTGSWHEAPLGDVMVLVGQWFDGKPYVAGTLDESAIERLVIKLDGFDCVTFVESVLALSRTIKDRSYSYGDFERHMRSQRYRYGELDGYCSRLHYFSEWIVDNEKRGHVRNITRELGGRLLDKRLDFMSSHRESYPQLKSDSLFAGIVEIEKDLESLQMYYIPQSEISASYSQLETGDIVALATDIGGLDVAHTGLVFKHEDGSAGLLHASTLKGVIVSQDLQAYVENNKRQIGIVIARPLELPNVE